MTFENRKKTYLAKLDKSKKGEIDEKVVALLQVINAKEDYFTTSSCSGRIFLWKCPGKKDEMEWLKVSHDLVKEDFFKLEDSGLVWLRLEPFILHVCCKDLETANKLLEQAKKVYKKSCILSISNKIVVEVKGSEFIEIPFYGEGKLLFSGEVSWLLGFVNKKLENIWLGIEEFRELVDLL